MSNPWEEFVVGLENILKGYPVILDTFVKDLRLWMNIPNAKVHQLGWKLTFPTYDDDVISLLEEKKLDKLTFNAELVSVDSNGMRMLLLYVKV